MDAQRAYADYTCRDAVRAGSSSDGQAAGLDSGIALGHIPAVKIVTYTPAARRAFRRLPEEVQMRLSAALRRYAETGHGDVAKLRGGEGARLRSGDYRVIFVETAASLEVRAIGYRREVYR